MRNHQRNLLIQSYSTVKHDVGILLLEYATCSCFMLYKNISKQGLEQENVILTSLHLTELSDFPVRNVTHGPPPDHRATWSCARQACSLACP